MRPRARLLGLGALVSAALVRGACACGGDDIASDGGVDAGVDRRKDGNDAGPVDAGPCGKLGYALLDDYDVTCGLCYATEAKYLPPPIRWEPCDSTATPGGIVCKQMVQDWTSTVPFAGAYRVVLGGGWTAPNGTVQIAFGRFVNEDVYRIVADVDGPVRQTIYELHSDQCTVSGLKADYGHSSYTVYDQRLGAGTGGVGGDTDVLKPRALSNYLDKIERSFHPVDGAFLEQASGTLVRRDWATSSDLGKIADVNATEGGLVPSFPAAGPGAIFWKASAGTAIHKQRVWTQDGGTQDLISFGNDTSQAATNLGTDGKDIVWQYSSGRVGQNGPFPVNSVMASPYATSAAGMIPRRLRSDGTGIGVNPFVVGCGYAVHDSTLVPNENGMLLVRLSDGRSWTLTAPISADWQWQNPIALTCDELFATVVYDNPRRPGLGRVRLDSLGPGLAPD